MWPDWEAYGLKKACGLTRSDCIWASPLCRKSNVDNQIWGGFLIASVAHNA